MNATRILLGLVLASGGWSEEPIHGYKGFLFGDTQEQVRAKSSVKLKVPQDLGIDPKAFFPKVTALLDQETKVLGGSAMTTFYFFEGKLSEVRVYRLLVDESMRSRPFFEETETLLTEKYGKPTSRGIDQYKALPLEKAAQESERHFLWLVWESGDNRLRVALENGPGPSAVSFRYRTKTFDAYSAEQDRLRKLRDL